VRECGSSEVRKVRKYGKYETEVRKCESARVRVLITVISNCESHACCCGAGMRGSVPNLN